MDSDVASRLRALATSPRPRVLVITHGWGGGVRRHVDELVHALGTRAEPLVLSPAAPGRVRLAWSRDDERLDLWFALPGELATMLDVLRALGVARVHLHHVDGLPQDVLGLASALGVPLDVTLHDAYAYCPRYHLERGDGRYCACRAAATAATASRAGPRNGRSTSAAGATHFARRSRTGRARSRRRATPRRASRATFPTFPSRCGRIRDDGYAAAPMSHRVAILGRLTRDKGFDVVVACARDAERRGLPLAFRVLGSTEAPLPPLPAGRISMTGEFPEGELSRLVAAESPDMMLFAAQWPETWSYTLTAALATGRPIVASSLGALGERLAGVPNATIVPWDAPAAAWNDALVAGAAAARRRGRVRARGRLAGLRRAARRRVDARAARASVDAAARRAPRRRAARRPAAAHALGARGRRRVARRSAGARRAREPRGAGGRDARGHRDRARGARARARRIAQAHRLARVVDELEDHRAAARRDDAACASRARASPSCPRRCDSCRASRAPR
jgi:glycosyltransferase involved in cell wall biosynthesis